MNLNKYTFEEVYDKALKYFNGNDLAASVWIRKYALKDSSGNIYELTPDDTHHRMASEFARIEKNYPNPMSEDEIYGLLKNFKYIVPQGSPMAGIGNNFQIMSLSNCFVTGEAYDSYGGIMWTDQQLAQLYKRRCGTGADLSHIRPKNTKVTNAALTTTGVVPFMERYSSTTREVASEGRRGALLLSYHIKGMDAADFISSKSNRKKITGANISVKISDDFIHAVKTDSNFTQQFPVDSLTPTYTQEVKARDLWNLIIKHAWKDAEPGILMWDTAVRESIGDCYTEEGFNIVTTNPCVVGNTVVLTSKGYKNVQTIFNDFNNKEVNYEIITYNEATQTIENGVLQDVLLTKRNANVIQLQLEDDTILELTPDHKVFTENRGWIEAANLTIEDILIKIE